MAASQQRAEGTRSAALAWLRGADADAMELMGDRYVELAKSLGASDDEIDAALAENGQLGLAGPTGDGAV